MGGKYLVLHPATPAKIPARLLSAENADEQKLSCFCRLDCKGLGASRGEPFTSGFEDHPLKDAC